MAQFWTILTYLHSLAGPTVTLLYPLYASICAIETPSKLDDAQWLAYWILYSFLTLLEMVAKPVLDWVPIWYEMKVILVAWLVLPQLRGAAFIYERFVRQQLRKTETKVVGKVEKPSKSGGGLSPSKSGGGGSPSKEKKKFMAFVTSKKGEQEAF